MIGLVTNQTEIGKHISLSGKRRLKSKELKRGTLEEINLYEWKRILESISRDYFKTFKNHMSGYILQALYFRKENGKLALKNKENCELLAKYFEELLNCEKPTKNLNFRDSIRNGNSRTPDLETVKMYLEELKNNKAPGEDNCMTEMLKASGELGAKIINEKLDTIWRTEKIPQNWKVALILPLHKKGDKADVNN